MRNSDSEDSAASTPLVGARSALILLFVMNLLNFVDRQILSAVVPKFREELFGANADHNVVIKWLLNALSQFLGDNPENALIGLLGMGFMVTYMLCVPLFGALGKRRWLALAIGICLWSLACGASGLATTFTMLLLTRCLVGVGEAAFGPIAPALISDYYPVARRGRAMAVVYSAMPVGSALGFAIGGVIASSFLGWRWAFFATVPPGIILALICLFMKEPVCRKGETCTPSDSANRKAKYGELLRNKSFLFDTLGMTAMTFAVGGIAFWMPTYIHNYRGETNLAKINLIFGAILVLTGISATFFGSWISDKLRPRFPGADLQVSGWTMLMALPFWIATLLLPFPWAWLSLFGTCFCIFVSTGPTQTALANVTRPAIRSSAFAFNIFVIHALGDVISPLVVGAVTDAAGNNMNVAFQVVSLTVLLAGVFWLWGARYLAADVERVSQGSDS